MGSSCTKEKRNPVAPRKKRSKTVLAKNQARSMDHYRKVLSDIAIREPEAFKALVDQARAALG